jgi:hypothetical protein
MQGISVWTRRLLVLLWAGNFSAAPPVVVAVLETGKLPTSGNPDPGTIVSPTIHLLAIFGFQALIIAVPGLFVLVAISAVREPRRLGWWVIVATIVGASIGVALLPYGFWLLD